jgi:methylenetetrahydrofolate reductase (NADPH)
MPVTALRSVPRMAEMGAALPDWAVARLEEANARGGADAVRQAGVGMATELCERLLAAGAPGLHFYTLNRSSATREIYAALGLSANA